MDWIPLIFIIFKALVLCIGMFFAIKWHYDQDRKRNETSEMCFFATMIVSLALSLIGIVYAGCWGHAVDGGRGGALACAFTFIMSFMSRPNAQAVLTRRPGAGSLAQSDILAEPEPVTLREGLDQIARLKVQTEQLRAAIFVTLTSAQRDKIYLGVASMTGTLAWKFGDGAAAWLNFGH